MNPALRDRQALKRLRKMEQSASLRLGEHITTAIVKPWRLPFLPLSFPLLSLRIGLEQLGLMPKPETRVEWARDVPGKGLLVFVDGYSPSYVKGVMQDLVDVNKLRDDLDITVVCTGKYQSIFIKTEFPVFVLPEKVDLAGERVDDWGVLLEEQLGGITSFFQPAMILIVGPYPHRSLKNLVRANPSLKLIHDQRPAKTSKKKMTNQLFTHLSGVLRLRSDDTIIPDSVEVHRVDELGMTSWLSKTIASLNTEPIETLSFNEDASKRLIEVVHAAKRDTKIITSEIDRLTEVHGIESVYSLLMFTLINLELTDDTRNKKNTRDLFVGGLRSLGGRHFEYMLELADWRLDRYQDERAAKTVIQFLRNAGRVEEAAVYLKYVQEGEWKAREIQTVTSRMLSQYGISGPSKKEFSEMETYEVEAIVRADLKEGDCATLKFELTRSKGGIRRKVKVLMNILRATTGIHNHQLYDLYVEHGLFEHDSMYLAKRLNTAFLQYGDAASALLAITKGPSSELVSELKKTETILSKVNGSWLSSIGPISSPTSALPQYDSEILYLAHMALPFESAGYCTRTHGLLTNLRACNPNISVQTRLGYPLDKTKLDHLTDDDVHEQYEIDGLIYRYHPVPDEGIADEDEVAYIERAAIALIESARKTRPALIQAASNHINGAIGLKAAQALGVPFIYEVRGLWHMSRVARQPHFLNHAEYNAMDQAEIAICLEADIVLAITHAVRYYLIEKGVDPHRILVLPNGVDTNRFVETGRDKELEQELELDNELVIGYVGSFVQYEGLDLLIQAFAKLVDVESNVKLLLVGDGSIRQDLEDLVDELRIREHVIFTGRVPHDEVVRYHSLIDIAPFPRTPDIVCEFISPLKPFESMAMGQVVVASDVAALKEIITDGEHGRLFKKGNNQSLFEVLWSLVQDENQRESLKNAGRAWVIKERDWSTLSAYLHEVHQHLLLGSPLPKLKGSGQALSITNGKVSTVIQGKPTIMIIMDEFSTTALAPDATLIRPTPDNWMMLLNDHSIDMLVVESAWEGNDKSWHRKVGWYSEQDIADLKNLVEACRSRNIPTVFYNKEDPVHFNRFSKTSTLFDHVFTTDEGCIPRYEALENSLSQSVDWIRFAAQPAVHHPYDTFFESRKNVAFAGTYYAGKYPDRCKIMDMMFDNTPSDQLILYNRQSDGGNPQYTFPIRFQENIMPKLEYSEMLKKHREHKLFINVNSVTDSRTMIARRVFEIPASGAALVSGPGLGLETVFGNIVPVLHDAQTARATITRLLDDDEATINLIRHSRRVVLREHTNQKRLEKMFLAAGLILSRQEELDYSLKIEDNSVSLCEILLFLARQSFLPQKINLPSAPADTASKLIWKVLESRGVSLTSEDVTENFVALSEISLLDDFVLEDIELELQNGSSNIRFMTQSGMVVATSNLEKFHNLHDLEYHVRVVDEGGFAGKFDLPEGHWTVPEKILLAGHDLKFAEPLAKVFSEMGIKVLVDKWGNHDVHNEEESLKLYNEVDAVWCEWALGNTVFFTNLEDTKPIFVRFHAQERKLTKYLSSSNWSKINSIGFVSPEYMGLMSEKFPLLAEKFQYIPNARYLKGTYRPSGVQRIKRVGLVGMVPQSKRLDRAIELLEHLLVHDPEYQLHIAGKGPEAYNWLQNRPEELEFYSSLQNKISTHVANGNIVLHGFMDNIQDFYKGVDCVISVSDDESFHLTLIDGPQFGAAAFSLNWKGSEKIYPEWMLFPSIQNMAESILGHQLESSMYDYSTIQNRIFSKNFQIEKIAISILRSISGEKN